MGYNLFTMVTKTIGEKKTYCFINDDRGQRINHLVGTYLNPHRSWVYCLVLCDPGPYAGHLQPGCKTSPLTAFVLQESGLGSVAWLLKWKRFL